VKKVEQQPAALTRANQWIRLSAALGLVSAIYLTWHYRLFLTGAGDQAGCNVSAFVNCDTIAASSWSKLFGIPLSVWGAGGYVALMIHTTWALRSRDLKARTVGTLMLILPFAIGLLTLPLVSFLSIRALCLGCMVSWVADIGLVVFGVKLLREELKHRQWQLSFQSFLPTITLSAVVIAGLAWVTQAPARVSREEVKRGLDRSRPIAKFEDFTVVDRLTPTLGDPQAPVTIVYFTDFQCPYCKFQTQALKELIKRRGHDVRAIYRNYPLDPSCNFRAPRGMHPFACTLARLAMAAQRLGVYSQWSEEIWAAQERLTADLIRQISRKYSLDDRSVAADSEISQRLLKDIVLGEQAGVPSTPTIVINGKLVVGFQPVEKLESLVTELLNQKK
jgi:protein-disulfide isomerase/uncharacterized membrane protein